MEKENKIPLYAFQATLYTGEPHLVESDWCLAQNITSGFKTAMMGEDSEAFCNLCPWKAEAVGLQF